MGTPSVYITPIDTVPTSGPKAEAYATLLRGQPESLAEVMVAPETGDFLDRMEQEFGLGTEQKRGIAEFLRDVLTGLPLSQNIAGDLARMSGTKPEEALQILRAIEQDLLKPAGMTLADISKATTGPEVREEAGRLLIKFESLDDLMASVEELPAPERMKFLNSVKQENRVLVLKALSQLKLGTDGSGKPMTFARLVAQEASSFGARDWVDVLGDSPAMADDEAVRPALVNFLSAAEHIADAFLFVSDYRTAVVLHAALGEALARAKPAVARYIRWTPYFAGVGRKDGSVDEQAFGRFTSLPEEERRRLVSRDAAVKIDGMIRNGAVPENFGSAVAKIIFLVTLGDLAPDMLAALFGEKLGLGPEKGREVAERIRAEFFGGRPVAEKLPEPEPRPQKTAPAAAGQQGVQGAIIDLRKRG
ncbi:MAG TPA: hypothetical protein VD862_01365 [Candidatus Paceibacterota bacterium]|nr:hypothetical protein [Candidatus Paceibacterota bacterium]